MTNGKGSAPRGQTPEERKRYEQNYDRIFRRGRKREVRSKPQKGKT